MKESKVKEYFDRESNAYKGGNKPGTVDKVRFVEEFGEDNQTLLDVGCGSGFFINKINTKTTVNAVGFDISREMLSPSDPVVQASVSDLPFKSEKFDFIHIDRVLHHLVGDTRAESLENVKRCINRLYDLLDDEGYLIITEHIFESYIYPPFAPFFIFHLLKHGSSFLNHIHPEIEPGLEASFFTRSQLKNIVSDLGSNIIESRSYTSSISPLERTILSHRGNFVLISSSN